MTNKMNAPQGCPWGACFSSILAKKKNKRQSLKHLYNVRIMQPTPAETYEQATALFQQVQQVEEATSIPAAANTCLPTGVRRSALT